MIREVPIQRLQEEAEWGSALDLDLEAEFWDLISNSDHDRYRQWHNKVKNYVAANASAEPRLRLMLSAGAVFALAPVFQAREPLTALIEMEAGDFIADAISGADEAFAQLTTHEPAHVFLHNNEAMLAFLLTAGTNPAHGRDVGLCHLERMRQLQESNPSFFGTEGRAAAPFTYGMVHEEPYIDYAIEMLENCDTWICNWTSKLAPFKPVGQMLLLAEMYAIKATLTSSEATRQQSRANVDDALARAETMAAERDWPFMERIESLRTELATRTYTDGLGLGRFPMPVYADEVNCSTCHIGGRPGTTGESLDNPYAGHDTITAIPPAPGFLTAASADICDPILPPQS